MSSEKVNMFDKAAEDRRKKIVEENIYVADEIMASKVENQDNVNINTIDNTKSKDDHIDKSNDENNSLKNIFNKDKVKKRRCSYYLDDKVDDFFIRLGRITDISKSEIVNQLLIIAIAENPDIQELVKRDKKVKKILDEYYE